MFCLVIGSSQFAQALSGFPELDVEQITTARPSPVDLTKALRNKPPSNTVIVMVDTGDASASNLIKANFKVVLLAGIQAAPRQVPGCQTLVAPITVTDIVSSINMMMGSALSSPEQPTLEVAPSNDGALAQTFEVSDSTQYAENPGAEEIEAEAPTWIPPEGDPPPVPAKPPPWETPAPPAPPPPPVVDAPPPWETPAPPAPPAAAAPPPWETITAGADNASGMGVFITDPVRGLVAKEETAASLWGAQSNGAASPVSPIRVGISSAPAVIPQAGLFNPAAVELRNGRIVVIVVPKGGTGKSTFSLFSAFFTADALARSNKKVCLLDANLQQADAIRMLKRSQDASTIVNLVGDVVNRQTVSNIIQHIGNLDIVFGPLKPEEANPNIITPQMYASVAAVLREMYDYVIVDTPVADHYHPLFDQFLIPIADYMVCVLTPDRVPTERAIAYLLLKEAPVAIGGAGVDRGRIGIVLNKVTEDRVSAVTDSRHSLQAWNWLGMVKEDVTWREATDRGEIPNFTAEAVGALAGIWYKITGEQVFATQQAAPERSKESSFLRRRAKR